MSNLDKTCEMIRRGHSESVRAFVEELNPTLCHFLSAFNPKPEQVCEMMHTLITAFLMKLEKREQPLKNSKIHLLAGALKMVRDQDMGKEFLQKVRNLPYEEILTDALPQSFFTDLNNPTVDYWEWFRNNQLSAATKFLLDSLFIEGLKVSEFSKLFQISDAILEPYIFTLFHRLSREPELQGNSENELEIFLKNLSLDLSDKSHSPESFTFRVNRLRNMFRIDIRKRLSPQDISWILEQLLPDRGFEEHETFTDNPSIIETIRKKNELERLQALEKKQAEESVDSDLIHTNDYTKARKPQEIFKILQVAIFILFFFLGFSVYKTLAPDKSSDANLPDQSTIKSVSLEALQNIPLQNLGTYSDAMGEQIIQSSQVLNSGKETLFANLNNGIMITISPFSSISIHTLDRLEVIFGEIKIEKKSGETAFEVFSKNGAISFTLALIRFSKWYPTYSVAGVERGDATVIQPFKDLIIKSGHEIILGPGLKPAVTEFSSQSFEHPSFRIGSKPGLINSLRVDMFDQIEDDVLNERLLERKKLEGQPTIKQKDFWDKL